MDSIPTYGRRKEGREKPTYISEDVKKVLGPTYGVLVYQEQINSLAQVMAGFTLSEADLFRRGVSKKDSKVLKGLQEKFIKGSVKNGYTLAQATEMYNRIYKFADYGFNKSHAVGYAILACQMAFLKAKFPLEFYASILQTSASTNDVKFNEIVSEMKSLNIEMSLPDINNSEIMFSIKDGKLIYPLSEISGVPYMMVNNIISERKARGPYTDFFNFISRLYPYKISEKNIESLINSGSFDTLTPSRETLRASINRGLQYAELNYNGDGQINLSNDFIQAPSLIEKEDNPLINLNLEYDTIGIMLSNNPLRFKQDTLKAKGAIPIDEANESTKTVTFGGIIKARKVISTKKGVPMAFIKLFDETSEIEVTIFSDLFTNTMKYLDPNTIVLVTVQNRVSRGEKSFIAQNIELLED